MGSGHVRGTFGSVRVLLLPLLLPHAFRRDVVLHLPIVAVFVSPRQIFKLLLLSRSQSLNTHTHTTMLHPLNHTLTNSDMFYTHSHTFHRSEQVLENLVKFTVVPGLFFLCSSRQERMKKAYAEVRPFGLFASFTMAATRTRKYNKFTLYMQCARIYPIKCTLTSVGDIIPQSQ